MNAHKIADMFGLDLEEAAEIIRIFIKTAEADLNTIQMAVDREDIEIICHAAHSLKGAAGNLGLSEMSAAARKIENDAGSNRLAEIRKGLDSLFRQLAQLESQTNETG